MSERKAAALLLLFIGCTTGRMIDLAKPPVKAASRAVTAASVNVTGSWPLPSTADVPCTGCLDAANGKLTPGYPSNLRFVGRWLESQAAQDEQQPFKTARARNVVVVGNRVYFLIGSAVFAYDLDRFLARTAAGEQLAHWYSVPVSGNYQRSDNDRFLLFDQFFYAENIPDNGWQVVIADGQKRLYQFDVDDRGSVYLAYSLFGWGIVQDVPGGAALMPSYVQVLPSDANGQVIPHEIAVVKSSAAGYYALVSSGDQVTNLYDVTDRSHPVLRATLPFALQSFAHSADLQRIAIPGDGRMRIHTGDALASGGAPLADFPGAFTAVASDGVNFYGATDTTSGLVITKFFPLGNTYAETEYATHRGGSTFSLNYSSGYLTWSGNLNGFSSIDVYRLDAGGPVALDLANFPQRYYVANRSVAGYATPNNGAFYDSVTVTRSGHTYLIATAYSLGDIYEILDAAPPQPPPTPVPVPVPVPVPTPTSGCLRGDVNDDGVVNVADLFYLINYLFAGGPPPK